VPDLSSVFESVYKVLIKGKEDVKEVPSERMLIVRFELL
jgi:hypothetical protein